MSGRPQRKELSHRPGNPGGGYPQNNRSGNQGGGGPQNNRPENQGGGAPGNPGESVLLDKREDFKKKDFTPAIKNAQAEDRASEVFVLRPQFASGPCKGKEHVFTNHFVFDNFPKGDLYQYKVIGLVTEEQQSDGKTLPRARRQELMDRAISHCPVLRNSLNDFATDNLENIITWKDLSSMVKDKFPTPAQPLDTIQSWEIVLSEASGDRKAVKRALELRFEGRIPVSQVDQASRGNITQLPLDARGDNTMTAVQAINIIIGHAARTLNNQQNKQQNNQRSFQVGSNKFFSESNSFDLGFGLVGYKGFFFTLRHGMGTPLLNVSSASSAFYRPIKVSEFMQLFGKDIKALKGALKGVRVSITHEDRERSIADISQYSPRNLKFKQRETAETSVADHLQQHKKLSQSEKKTISSSNHPCIQIGTGEGARHFPAELLKIMPHQLFKGKLPPQAVSNMIRYAQAIANNDRQSIVLSGLPLFGVGTAVQSSVMMNNAGLNINPRMVKVPANVLTPPKIAYSNNAFAVFSRDKGQWNLNRLQFLEGKANSKRLPQTIVLVYQKGQYQLAKDTKTALIDAMRLYAGQLAPTNEQIIEFSVTDNFAPTYGEGILSIRKRGFKDILAVLINPKDRDCFADFKRISDQILGVHSLCLRWEKVTPTDQRNIRGLAQYMGNVSMKVNAKIGHTNHEVKFPDTLKPVLQNNGKFDTMILGADVTHPAPGSGNPSITAVVGSVDHYCSRFLGSVRYQRGGEEIIQDMEDMVKDRLRAWYKLRKSLPSKILFYRDGVSESQYTEVLLKEVRQIESAYERVRQEKQSKNPNPLKLTTVIVTKRHHTRFYKDDPNGRGDCSHGTCIDSGVTHPCYFDFFLQSHNPLQGTAKPTYYFVLKNGMGFTAQQIQDLTNSLCYAYIRCTMPVSYVPAAYYADRLCERARIYVHRIDTMRHSDLDFKAAGEKPPRPSLGRRNKDDKRSKEVINAERTQRLQEARHKEDVWFEKITEAWRKKQIGRGDNGEPNPEGPWNPKLNDSMFWM